MFMLVARNTDLAWLRQQLIAEPGIMIVRPDGIRRHRYNGRHRQIFLFRSLVTYVAVRFTFLATKRKPKSHCNMTSDVKLLSRSEALIRWKRYSYELFYFYNSSMAK